MLSSALARKWLGVDTGENAKPPRTGEAIAWVKDAQARLEEMEDSAVREKMKGLGLGRGSEKKKEARTERKGRVGRELQDIKAWVSSYQALNDKVSHLMAYAQVRYDQMLTGHRSPSSLSRKSRHWSSPLADRSSMPSRSSLRPTSSGHRS